MEEDAEKSLETRIDSIRGLSETLDLLFQEFCQRRIGKAWKRELKQIRKWLRAETSATARKSAA